MIESVNDYLESMKDIVILIKYAQRNQKNALDKYQLFNKTAIVLMCSHFEVFVEAFLAEHVDVLKKCYNNISLPQYMKDNYIDDTFKAYKEVPYPSKNQASLKALFKLHEGTPCNLVDIGNLQLEIKYGFGKHGKGETDRLFRKFGLGDFVNTKIYKASFANINSTICIRNNIIHEGKAPNLSYKDVVKYKDCFLDFANGLEKHVIENQVNYYGKQVYI